MNGLRKIKGVLGHAYDRILAIREQWSVMGYNPFAELVIFDVGANTGTSFGDIVGIASKSQFYAFEPTPDLAGKLTVKFGGYKNYHLVRKAVGENPGMAKFNVVELNDGGCSSLLDFSDNVRKTWAGRTDLVVAKKIDVEVIRLEDFVKSHGISYIDFIHIDTQGMDLSVLRSLGPSKQIKVKRCG